MRKRNLNVRESEFRTKVSKLKMERKKRKWIRENGKKEHIKRTIKRKKMGGEVSENKR